MRLRLGDGAPWSVYCRTGSIDSWPAGTERDVPDELGAQLLAEHPGAFERVDDAADLSERHVADVDDLVEHRARDLAAEIRAGEHDDVLDALWEADRRRTVRAAIEDRREELGR